MKHDSQHIYNLTWTHSCLQKWQHQYKQIDRPVIKIKHLFKLKERLEIIYLISCQCVKTFFPWIGKTTYATYSGFVKKKCKATNNNYDMCTQDLKVTVIMPISGRNFPTLASTRQRTVWGIIRRARGDSAMPLQKWLQSSTQTSLEVSKKIKNKNTPLALWMKGPDLILALFLYIDEHESPLLWIASLWALGHRAGPRAQSYQ